METITNSLFNNNKLSSLLSQAARGGLDQQYSVNTRTKAKAELEITTAEGDRVTLFSQSRVRTSYSSYDSRGKLAGEGSSGATDIYQVVTTNKAAIAVEGDLSEEELADIQRLLQSIEDMFTNYLSRGGTIEEDMASSLSLDSMKTLSHFDAELKYSEKIRGFGMISENPSAETENAAPADLTTVAAFKARTKASLHLSGSRLTNNVPEQALSQSNTPAAPSGEDGKDVITPGTGSTVAAGSPSVAAGPISNGPVMNSISMINMEAKIRTSINVKMAQSMLKTAPAVSGTPQQAAAPEQPPADGTKTPVSIDKTTTPNQASDASSIDPGTSSATSSSRINLIREFSALIQQSSLDMNRFSAIFSQFIPALTEHLSNEFSLDENQRGAVTQMGEDILNTVQSSSA